MRKEQRLRRRSEFSAAYQKGQTQGDRLIVVRTLANHSDITRFGFAVSKVVGGAVVRNRVKRRLREAAMTLKAKPGLDVVVGARKAAAEATYSELREAFERLMRRSDALEAPAGKGQR